MIPPSPDHPLGLMLTGKLGIGLSHPPTLEALSSQGWREAPSDVSWIQIQIWGRDASLFVGSRSVSVSSHIQPNLEELHETMTLIFSIKDPKTLAGIPIPGTPPGSGWLIEESVQGGSLLWFLPKDLLQSVAQRASGSDLSSRTADQLSSFLKTNFLTLWIARRQLYPTSLSDYFDMLTPAELGNTILTLISSGKLSYDMLAGLTKTIRGGSRLPDFLSSRLREEYEAHILDREEDYTPQWRVLAHYQTMRNILELHRIKSIRSSIIDRLQDLIQRAKAYHARFAFTRRPFVSWLEQWQEAGELHREISFASPRTLAAAFSQLTDEELGMIRSAMSRNAWRDLQDDMRSWQLMPQEPWLGKLSMVESHLQRRFDSYHTAKEPKLARFLSRIQHDLDFSLIAADVEPTVFLTAVKSLQPRVQNALAAKLIAPLRNLAREVLSGAVTLQRPVSTSDAVRIVSARVWMHAESQLIDSKPEVLEDDPEKNAQAVAASSD